MLEPGFDFAGRQQHWKQLFFSLALAGSLAFLSSCGSNSSSSASSPPSVTVSCATNPVTALGTSQCAATVLNLSSTLVTWSVSGTGTGNFGSIDSKSGLYTAPSAVPTNNVVTITATSQADNTTKGTTSITISQPTQISAVACVDPVTQTQPSPLTLSSGNQLDCSATTSTGTAVPVNWTVANANKLGGDVGSISTQGIYTAPLVPPPGQTITITATSQAVSTQTMSVTATVVFGNKILSGPYAFSTSGRLTNSSNAFFARVGKFTAGGGTLTGGIEDTNQSGTSGGVGQQVTFTGSYSIDTDGRGTMQFCENTSSGCPTGSTAATAFFRIVVISPQQARIVDFSLPGAPSASTTTAGEIISESQLDFGAGDQNLNGVYSFSFSGISSGGSEESAVGDFAANGFGTINAGTSTTPGAIDFNPGGTQTVSSTTYGILSSGRGTATLNGSKFSFYLVSASQVKFLQIDAASSILTGDAFKQQASAACPWGLNALSGSTAFETVGTSSGVVLADVGSFTASNNGTTGSVAAGSLDENSGGAVSSAIASLSGTYTVDPCGRGTLTIGSHSYVFYVISATRAVLQETTSGVVAHGLLVQPQGGPFVNGSLNGSYALSLSGTNAAGASGQREDIVGQLTADGAGKVTSGSLDINSFGATQTGVSTTGTYTPDSAPAGTLRATMALTATPSINLPQKLVLYLVSPTQFYVLDTDATGAAIGTLDNQF